MIRRILTLICCVATLTACSTQQSEKSNDDANKVKMTVTADLSGETRLNAGDELVLRVSGDDEVLAEVTLDDNKCFTTTITTYPEQFVSITRANKPVLELITEGNDISIAPGEDAMMPFVVSGTRYNELINEFGKQATELLQPAYFAESEEEADAIIDKLVAYIEEQVIANKDNLLSLQMVQVYGQFAENDKRFTELFEMIDPKYDYLPLYRTTARTLIGGDIMDVSLKDTEGRDVSAAALCKEGKWVLIDFWATWCPPCRAEIPHLVAAYEKFAPKGLEIYGITLDRPGDEQKWKEFTENNNMTWVNAWGYEDDKCEAAETYNVNSIPTNFLYSPEGKLVAKNLRGEEIEKILAEHIK